MQEDFLTYTSCGQRKIPEPELPTASDSVLELFVETTSLAKEVRQEQHLRRRATMAASRQV